MIRFFSIFIFCFHSVLGLSSQNSKGVEVVDAKGLALVIGISDYEHVFDLQYGASDASAFANFLTDKNGGNLQKENVTSLFNSEATVSNIRSGLRALANNARTGDVVVIYYSGHSDIRKSENNEKSFVVTHETDLTKIETTALPFTEIADIVKNLEQQGVSVQFYWDSNSFGRNGEILIDETLDEALVHQTRIMACSPNEMASESAKWSGGVFTHYLIRGLYGEADTDLDKAISLLELDRYLSENVGRETEGKQNPVTQGQYETILCLVKDGYQGDINYTYESNQNIEEYIVDDSDEPYFSILSPELCVGQALMSNETEFLVKIRTKNPVDYLLFNEEKITKSDTLEFEHRINIKPGLNKIYIRSQLGVKSHLDSIIVFSEKKLSPFEQLAQKTEIKHYALFIAVEDYVELTDLGNPVLDARTLALELKENFGFEIDTLMNPTKTQIQDKLMEYATRFNPEEAKNRNDHLLIYLTGHGSKSEQFGDGYFAGTDSEKNEIHHNSYISFEQLRTQINALGFKHILVMLDACYGGLFDSELASNSGEKADVNPYIPPDINKFVKEKLEFKTRRMISAGRAVPVYDGTVKENSPFTKLLLEGLRNVNPSNPILTIEKILVALDKNSTVIHTSHFLSNQPGSNFLMFYKNQ